MNSLGEPLIGLVSVASHFDSLPKPKAFSPVFFVTIIIFDDVVWIHTQDNVPVKKSSVIVSFKTLAIFYLYNPS